MTMSDDDEKGLILDQKGNLLPPPPRNRRIPLNTSREVRREMARVYSDMRHGMIETSDGSKLIYALTQINAVIQTSDLEARLEALESNQTTGGA